MDQPGSDQSDISNKSNVSNISDNSYVSDSVTTSASVGQTSQMGQTSQTHSTSSGQASQISQANQTAVTQPPLSAPAAAADSGGAQQTPVAPPKLKEREAGASSEQLAASKTEKVAGIDVGEADKVAKEGGDEYWENYAREIELEKEILEMGGVEKVESGEVKVPEKLATEMGIKPTTNIQTPIAKATDFSIRGVSLSDDQLAAGITKPTSTGIRWLVEWFIYQLLKAHFHIKRIKGKIFRERLGASS